MHEPAALEAVVLAALNAQDAMQFEQVVALADPESLLARFQQFCESSRPMTIELLAERRPDIPPEKLEAQLAHWKGAGGGKESRISNSVPGVHSHAELVALDPRDFLVRFMQKQDFRFDLLQRLRARGRPVPNYVQDFLERRRHEVLGSVTETPDLAHVLYRTVVRRDDGPDFIGQVEFVSVRRQPDGAWRLLVEDWHFLQPRGGSVVIIDEEFMDLYDDADWSGGKTEPPAP
jgi:hypothetical protein